MNILEPYLFVVVELSKNKNATESNFKILTHGLQSCVKACKLLNPVSTITTLSLYIVTSLTLGLHLTYMP